MLEEIKLHEARHRPAAKIPTPAGARLEQLTARLARSHVSVGSLASAAGVTAGGVALSVDVDEVCSATSSTEHLHRRICGLLRDRLPVTLTLVSLGHGDEAINRLEDFCAALRRVLVSGNLSPALLGIALSSQSMPLPTFRLVCNTVLGDGPRFALLHETQMRHHADRHAQEEIEHNWSLLWRRREGPWPLLPAYATNVTTRCPLLSHESATALLPGLAVPVPARTAWLPLELRLGDFSDGHGRLDWERLRQALRACVDVGDRILDHLEWPDAAQRSDACLNRRLAVLAGGIGDLIMEYGADPADLRTLQWADRLMMRISKTLWSRSQALAKRAGVLPALTHSDPTAASPNMARKGDWQRRWRNAVARSAVRHRNLLVMSPYAVLPSGDHDVKDFIDLLPALHHADAFSFADPVTRGCGNAEEFAAFHRRAFAVMERRNAASLVAAGT